MQGTLSGFIWHTDVKYLPIASLREKDRVNWFMLHTLRSLGIKFKIATSSAEI